LIEHVEVLSQLFHLFADRVEGVSIMKIVTTQGHGGLLRLLELYEIVPNFLSRSEIKTIFSLLLNAQVSSKQHFVMSRALIYLFFCLFFCQRNQRSSAAQLGVGAGLEFSFFVKGLLMFALYFYSKTGGAGTIESKVDAMLHRWKLADPTKLAAVRKSLSAKIR
jgi:hypothetical protein